MLACDIKALSRNNALAGICILFFLFAFLQLLTGKYLGKAKSILPPELETKRVSIATKHNQIVALMLLSLFAALFSIVALLRGSPRMWAFFAIAVLGLAELYAIRRLFKYDEQLCERCGFVCPHCHKPLYEPRSFINLNGLCPKCGKSILLGAQHSPVLS
jgi:uncharacterized membrane protein YuzA (DUF378 family)